jgi:manganese transport protein
MPLMETTNPESAKASAPSAAAAGPKSLWRSLGPSFIIAAVVVGPGTITVSSRIGAGLGTAMLWGLIIAGTFMWVFTMMSARIGILNRQSLLTITAREYGRWLAVVMGVLSFTVASAFQMGNYLACSTALNSLTGVKEGVWIAVVGIAALVFLFAARELYRVLEKVMMALVFVMVLAFIVNLAFAKPSLGQVVAGLKPAMWPWEMTGLIVAMVATTFSVIAALYQSTLAQQKGWTREHLPVAKRESMIGIGFLLAISMIIMTTSATVLKGATIGSAADLSTQLEPLLGRAAVILFSLGFLAAAFSSTIINAMIGGGLLADSLGLSSNINARPLRLFTAAAMAVGISASVYTLRTQSAIEGIVMAQQLTILAVPLCALVIILLANNPRVVGEHRNSIPMNVWAFFALAVLIGMSLFRFAGLWDKYFGA